MATLMADDAPAAVTSTKASASGVAHSAAGISSYYQAKLAALEVVLREKSQNLRRLEAQRNTLNTKG